MSSFTSSFSSSAPRALARALALALAASAAVACGHTEQEWGYQLDKAARLRIEKDASEQRAAKAEREAADAKGKAAALLAELETGSELEANGVRAPMVAVPEGLLALEPLGVRAFEKGDAVIVEIPNKALFTGAPVLAADGKALLTKVGAAIAAGAPAANLQGASYRVSIAALDASSRDGWDAALGRAREVLLFLRSDQGGLSSVPWSAAASVATADEIKAAFAAAPPAAKPKKGKARARVAKPLIGLVTRIEIKAGAAANAPYEEDPLPPLAPTPTPTKAAPVEPE